MANCKAELGMALTIVDLAKKEDVHSTLMGLLSSDNDLTENESEFQYDTLELGYDSEADRIVHEALHKLGYPNTINEFRELVSYVFKYISNQEYYGACEFDIKEVSSTKVALAYAYGGHII